MKTKELLKTVVERLDKQVFVIEDLTMRLSKLENPPKFKLGDCVELLATWDPNYIPYKIIGMGFSLEHFSAPAKRPYTYIQRERWVWMYTCINKEYDQREVREDYLKLSKKKIKE